MDHQRAEPPSIGEGLISVRAAIDLVATGTARRVTVAATGCEHILPGARALSRAAGLTLEAHWWRDGRGCEIAISREPEQLRRRDAAFDERGAPRVAS
jgi:hypothetical protein